MAENQFSETVTSLFKGMDSFLSSKTVIGDAIRIDPNTVIIPMVDMSFGVGAGAFTEGAKNNGAGGLGGRISPSAVLVIKDDTIRVMNVRNQDYVTRIVDMAPDLINRFMNRGSKDTTTDEDIMHEAFRDTEKGAD